MRSHPPPLLPFDHAGAEHLRWNGTTGEITCASVVAQRFHCAHDRLYRIELFLESDFHYKRSHLSLAIFAGEAPRIADGNFSRPLRITAPLAAETIVGHGWVSFEFAPIPDSAGKHFLFQLIAPDATPGNALSFRADDREDGGLSLGSRPRSGSLLFRAVCLRAPAMLPNFQRYLRAARGGTIDCDHTPLMVTLEASRPCNLGCVMCHRGLNPFNAKREGRAFMSLEIFRELDPILGDLLWIIAFGLGEPFLNPEYLSILSHARRTNPLVHVFTSTNGMCLPAEKVQRLVRESLISTLQISLDGARADTFESIRRGAVYETVVESFRRVVRERDQQRSRMLVRSYMLVMKSNADQVFDHIKLMADLGVDLIGLGTPRDWAFQKLRADTDDEKARIYEQVARGHEYLGDRGAMLDGPLLSELKRWQAARNDGSPAAHWGYDETAVIAGRGDRAASPCGVPWENLGVSASGEIRVCCNSYRSMGQLSRDAIATLWRSGGNYRALRTELTTRKFHEDCRACLAGGAVTPDLVTPAMYREGTIEDSGRTIALAALLGAALPATPIAEEPRLTCEIHKAVRVTDDAAGIAWRVVGELHAGADFPHRQLDPNLVVAVPGCAPALTTATWRSAGVARFAALVRPASRSARLPAPEIFLIDPAQKNLRLLRLAPGQPRATGDSRTTQPAPASSWTTTGAAADAHGFIDAVSFDGGMIHLRGWARDRKLRQPARRVLLLVNGEKVWSSVPWLLRPDVARAFADGPNLFGFTAELPLEQFRIGRTHTLSVAAVDEQDLPTPLVWGFGDTITQRFAGVDVHFSVENQTGLVSRRHAKSWPRRLFSNSLAVASPR